jgi:LysM repeat protein
MAKEDESPKKVIDSYRQRRGGDNSNRRNTVVFILAALLVIIGLNVLVFWLTGAELDLGAIFPSKTPTTTATLTPTPITPTATITLTPTEALPTTTQAPTLTPTRSSSVIYVAQEGDSLYTIAEQFDVDILTLIIVNRDRLGLDPANPAIFVGDEVLVPAPGESIPTPTPIPLDAPPGLRVEYIVRPGDSLELIAQRLRSTVDDILEYNEFLEEQEGVIYPGQILIVRVNLVTPVPTETGTAPDNTPGAIKTLTPTPSE